MTLVANQIHIVRIIIGIIIIYELASVATPSRSTTLKTPYTMSPPQTGVQSAKKDRALSVLGMDLYESRQTVNTPRSRKACKL